MKMQCGILVADGRECKVVHDIWPLGIHFPRPQLPPVSTLSRMSAQRQAHHKPGRALNSRAASMKAQPQNVRSRYLSTISTMEKLPVADLEATNGEQTKWLWLLNAGDMAARARSGITAPENLPGSPVQIVELLAKVSEK